jgi:hypothetical protein
MTDEQANAQFQPQPAQDIDRIRDILFGTQMREYDQGFQTIQRDLQRLQQDIDRLTEQLADQDKSQTEKLQALHRDMCQVDDDLRSELRQTAQMLTTEKVDRVTLGELFIELGTHLKTGGSMAELLKDLVERGQNHSRGEG